MPMIATGAEPDDWIPRITKPKQRPKPRPCVRCGRRTTGRSNGEPLCKVCFGGEDFPPTMQPPYPTDGRRNRIAPAPDHYFPRDRDTEAELANHGFPEDFDGFPDPEPPAWCLAGFESEEEAEREILWHIAERELRRNPDHTDRSLADLLTFTAPSPN